MVAFSAKFSTPPGGKTINGSQKRFNLKWWHCPPLSPCKISWKSRNARRRERTKCDFFTVRICRRQLCRYCFYSRADFEVFRPQGRHVAPIKVKFGREERLLPAVGPFLLPNFTLIGSGVGVYGPQNWKKRNFTNIIAPKGRVPCTIFTKFAGYMRVLSLYNLPNLAALLVYFDKWQNY